MDKEKRIQVNTYLEYSRFAMKAAEEYMYEAFYEDCKSSLIDSLDEIGFFPQRGTVWYCQYSIISSLKAFLVFMDHNPRQAKDPQLLKQQAANLSSSLGDKLGEIEILVQDYNSNTKLKKLFQATVELYNDVLESTKHLPG